MIDKLKWLSLQTRRGRAGLDFLQTPPWTDSRRLFTSAHIRPPRALDSTSNQCQLLRPPFTQDSIRLKDFLPQDCVPAERSPRRGRYITLARLPRVLTLKLSFTPPQRLPSHSQSLHSPAPRPNSLFAYGITFCIRKFGFPKFSDTFLCYLVFLPIDFIVELCGGVPRMEKLKFLQPAASPELSKISPSRERRLAC